MFIILKHFSHDSLTIIWENEWLQSRSQVFTSLSQGATLTTLLATLCVQSNIWIISLPPKTQILKAMSSNEDGSVGEAWTSKRWCLVVGRKIIGQSLEGGVVSMPFPLEFWLLAYWPLRAGQKFSASVNPCHDMLPCLRSKALGQETTNGNTRHY